MTINVLLLASSTLTFLTHNPVVRLINLQVKLPVAGIKQRIQAKLKGVTPMKKCISGCKDFFIFIWLLLGVFIIQIKGILLRTPSSKIPRRINNVLSWTSNFVAPASEKVLDMVVAHDLISRYYSNGEILDVAFGAGRFEEDALRPAYEKGAPIDGIDIEREHESSIATMKKRPWVRNAWKRSYLATGLPAEKYAFIFCNNGLMASDRLEQALGELWRVTQDNGILVFNMTTTLANKHTYFFYIILNSILFRRKAIALWRNKAANRVGLYSNTEELTTMLERAGWSIVETKPYFSGFYMYWHYLFNFPAYHSFFYYEVTGNAPWYYFWMKRVWRPLLESAIRNNFQAAVNHQQKGAKVYIAARKNSNSAQAKLLSITLKPIRAFIDVANACNLKCIMCDIFSKDARMKYSHPKSQFMELELFKKIINQSSKYVQSYFLQLRGEPLLHPRYTEMVAYCRKTAPQCQINFNTNGSLLNHKILDMLAEIGVNGVYFSLDAATKEIYDKIRIGSNFDNVMESIEYLLLIRSNSPVPLQVGVSFVIQDDNKHEQDLFIEQWRNKVDYIIFYTKANLNRLRPVKFFEPSIPPCPCSAIDETLVILVNGLVVPCCGDLAGEHAYGNLMTDDLDTILASHQAHSFSSKVRGGDILNIPICRECTTWMARDERREHKDGMLIIKHPFQTTYCCSSK